MTSTGEDKPKRTLAEINADIDRFRQLLAEAEVERLTLYGDQDDIRVPDE